MAALRAGAAVLASAALLACAACSGPATMPGTPPPSGTRSAAAAVSWTAGPAAPGAFYTATASGDGASTTFRLPPLPAPGEPSAAEQVSVSAGGRPAELGLSTPCQAGQVGVDYGEATLRFCDAPPAGTAIAVSYLGQAPVGIGTWVKGPLWNVRVASATEQASAAGPGGAVEKARGRFAVVTVDFVDESGAPLELGMPMLELCDAQGDTYQEDGAAAALLDAGQPAFFRTIAPGAADAAALVYDVPAGAALASLWLQVSVGGNPVGADFIGLGTSAAAASATPAQ